MRKSIIASILAIGLIGGTAQAAPPGPEGTIAVDPSSNLVLGGHVTFDVFVDDTNILDPTAEVDQVELLVACWQDPDAPGGGVVYQWGRVATDPTFPLIQQSGLAHLGMIWDATEPASCVGHLRYAFIKGKNHYLRTMDQVSFTVAAG